jgi:hypothetical protein
MSLRWASLPESDWGAFAAAVAFLDGRLGQRSTLEWALGLDAGESVKRRAVLEVLDSPKGRQLREPWRSAWRLIEESWNRPGKTASPGHGSYVVGDWIAKGDRSGALIQEIVALVEPILKVDVLGDPPRRPKSPTDLLSLGLTSGEIVDPAEIGLSGITDRPFLIELGHELDAAVVRGLDIGRRIGSEEGRGLWRLGGINRVYFVPKTELAAEEHEPDEFHDGIAPSVKLLYATIARLVEVDRDASLSFARRWQSMTTPIHTRLWAAVARDRRIAAPSEVAEFLRACDDKKFWNLHSFPEVAELRSRRFAELDTADQRAVLKRLRKQPPRNQWPKDVERSRLDDARIFWALRELRRIEIAGGNLPDGDKAWMTALWPKFESLWWMTRLDEGFPGTPMARFVPANPDSQYDLQEGPSRLAALELALSSGRRAWDDDPAQRAADWMQLPGRSEAVLADFEAVPDGGTAYPNVWNRFGWTHAPPQATEEITDVDIRRSGGRVLMLLERLSEHTVTTAIEGIAAWLDTWKARIIELPSLIKVWLRLWPIAVDATNAQQSEDEPPDLNVVATAAGDREPMDLDTLNTPVGKLVGVFLEACPTVSQGDRPFNSDKGLRLMRDAAISAEGRSGLIAKHRMIESVSWFLAADPEWTTNNLLNSLRSDAQEAVALWRAVARKTHFTKLLLIIGAAMVERAVDMRLGRETRRSLVLSLVVESLYALREGRDPAVPHARIQQMLRFLDDEVRGYAANVPQRFVSELTGQANPQSPSGSAEELFRSAVRPFLEQVWPQERSLVTPGVARALADLPAVCGEAFAEAVDAIDRFLVPFECWSMLEYGLYGEDDGEPKLSRIDNPVKADAFLRLLDRTIGTAEGAIIPLDLAGALEQVRLVAPQLAETQRFRRLAALTRH